MGFIECSEKDLASGNYPPINVVFTAEIENELPFYENNDVTEIPFITSLAEISPICVTCKSIVEYYETGTTDFGFKESRT